MAKPIKIIIALLIVFILGMLVFFIFSQKDNPENPSLPVENEKNEPIGGEKDDHDCLTAAGYRWCESKTKCLRVFEEFCPDAVGEIVDSIKKDTGISLSDPKETKFKWMLGRQEVVTDMDISGVSYSTKNISTADYQKVEDYLNSNLEADRYNIADGIVGGLRGYQVNYMACALNFRHEMTENSEGMSVPSGNNLNVDFSCGYFNKNDIPGSMQAK